MKLIKKLGHLRLISSTPVDISNYFSHYLSEILGNSDNYKFLKPVPLENVIFRENNLMPMHKTVFKE